MKKTNVPELLRMIRSWLWCNDKYKMYFSSRSTNNPNQFYCFFQDIRSGNRKHGHYWVFTEGIYIDFMGSDYKVKDLSGMLKHGVRMIQTVDAENELGCINWLAHSIPGNKGEPYKLPPIIPNNPLNY